MPPNFRCKPLVLGTVSEPSLFEDATIQQHQVCQQAEFDNPGFGIGIHGKGRTTGAIVQLVKGGMA